MAYSFLSKAIALPLVLGWLTFQGQQAGWYSPAVGYLLLSVAMAVVSLALSRRGVALLYKAERDRDRSDDQLRSSKDTELELQKSEERLRMAQSSSDMGVFDWDAKTNRLFWTPDFEILHGYEPGEVQSYADFRRVVHPDDVAEVEQKWQTAVRHHEPFDNEFRMVHKITGEVRWVYSRGRGFYNEAGELIRVLGNNFNITTRKQSELNNEFLYQLDYQLRQLADADAMAWETVSRLGDYLNVDRCLWHEIDWENRSTTVKNTWRREVPDVTGIYALDQFFTPEQLHCFTAGGTLIVNDVTTHPGTAPYAQNYLPLGAAAFISVPCLYAGKWIAVLSVNSKIARTWRSDEVALLQEIVARLWLMIEQTRATQALHQTAAELAQTNRLKDEFLAALSHELRTPLNPILGWTTLMQAQRLTEQETSEALDAIARNARQQIRLVDDLLEVSCAIQGKLKLEVGDTDVALALQNAIDSVQFAAIAKTITLEMQGLSSVKLIADGDRLQQIFWNLLSNAIKFTPENGRVEVELLTSDENRYAQVRVTDTGIGIAPEFVPYMFERFRQADGSSTRKYNGLGLGLSIAQQLTELHGGQIRVDSPGVGQGATFIVRLPIKTEGMKMRPVSPFSGTRFVEPVQGCLTETQASSILTGVRILVVDDDPDNLELISFLLEHEGATVTAMTSPRRAIELMANQSFDLVVSDIGMPELNGYELIQQLQVLPNYSAPALVLTAFVYQEDQQRAIEAGFQAYLTKPIDPIELLNVVSRLVNR
jgi:PAS domain S-box-containing protein